MAAIFVASTRVSDQLQITLFSRKLTTKISLSLHMSYYLKCKIEIRKLKSTFNHVSFSKKLNYKSTAEEKSKVKWSGKIKYA